MIVIEDQDGGRPEPPIKFLKKTAGECGQPLQIFGSQMGQWLFDARRPFLNREAKIMKEGGEVAVAFVQLIPQGTDLAGTQVACDEGGLAESRWRIDPDDGTFAGPIEHPVQSWTFNDRRKPWWRKLCEVRLTVHGSFDSAVTVESL